MVPVESGSGGVRDTVVYRKTNSRPLRRGDYKVNIRLLLPPPVYKN